MPRRNSPFCIQEFTDNEAVANLRGACRSLVWRNRSLAKTN